MYTSELPMFCRNIDSFLLRHISSTPYMSYFSKDLAKFSMLLTTRNLINFSVYMSIEKHDKKVDREEEDFKRHGYSRNI
jgi:hypothetical protein